MKKVLSVFVALILVLAVFAMPASAETKASEWKKGTGPVGIDFSDEGTKILIDEGVNLYYYQKMVNVKDFTVKFKVNAPDYSNQGCYVAITVGGNGKYTSAQGAQNFIIMWIRDDHLCIDPQILHSGKGGITQGSSRFFLDMATEDVVLHATQVDATTYQLDFNDGACVFKYDIPENLNFVEDLNGEGALGFGGSIGSAQSEKCEFGDWNILIKEINGVKMNGKNEPVSSDTTGTTGDSDTTGGSDVDPDTGIFTGTIGGEDTTDTTTEENATEEGGISILMIAIICGGVLLLTVAVVVIILLAVKLKKATAPAEEVTEEASEETTEE